MGFVSIACVRMADWRAPAEQWTEADTARLPSRAVRSSVDSRAVETRQLAAVEIFQIETKVYTDRSFLRRREQSIRFRRGIPDEMSEDQVGARPREDL